MNARNAHITVFLPPLLHLILKRWCPWTFKELDAVIGQEYARKARYSKHNIDDEFDSKVNGKAK